MGDGDDTEILPTERAIQTANTDNRGTQTSKEAISQLVDQSKTNISIIAWIVNGVLQNRIQC